MRKRVFANSPHVCEIHHWSFHVFCFVEWLADVYWPFMYIFTLISQRKCSSIFAHYSFIQIETCILQNRSKYWKQHLKFRNCSRSFCENPLEFLTEGAMFKNNDFSCIPLKVQLGRRRLSITPTWHISVDKCV